MTDFRSLCSQLLPALEACANYAFQGEHGCPTFDGEQLDAINKLIAQSKAALQHDASLVPSDAELDKLFDDHAHLRSLMTRSRFAAAARRVLYQWGIPF